MPLLKKPKPEKLPVQQQQKDVNVKKCTSVLFQALFLCSHLGGCTKLMMHPVLQMPSHSLPFPPRQLTSSFPPAAGGKEGKPRSRGPSLLPAATAWSERSGLEALCGQGATCMDVSARTGRHNGFWSHKRRTDCQTTCNMHLFYFKMKRVTCAFGNSVNVCGDGFIVQAQHPPAEPAYSPRSKGSIATPKRTEPGFWMLEPGAKPSSSCRLWIIRPRT